MPPALRSTLAEAGASKLVLAHLSRDNNTPAMALNAVTAALEAAGLALPVSVASRECTAVPHRSQEGRMQKVTIICTGKLKEKFYLDAAAEYAKRLSRFCTLTILELRRNGCRSLPPLPRSRRRWPERPMPCGQSCLPDVCSSPCA